MGDEKFLRRVANGDWIIHHQVRGCMFKQMGRGNAGHVKWRIWRIKMTSIAARSKFRLTQGCNACRVAFNLQGAGAGVKPDRPLNARLGADNGKGRAPRRLCFLSASARLVCIDIDVFDGVHLWETTGSRPPLRYERSCMKTTAQLM